MPRRPVLGPNPTASQPSVRRAKFPVNRRSNLPDKVSRRKGSDADPGDRNRKDRKSTRLNSSHSQISYAVFCLKKTVNFDPQSGLRIGVARPVGDTFEALRKTAAKNFGYGMALVFIALIGIVPIAYHTTRDVKL